MLCWVRERNIQEEEGRWYENVVNRIVIRRKMQNSVVLAIKRLNKSLYLMILPIIGVSFLFKGGERWIPIQLSTPKFHTEEVNDGKKSKQSSRSGVRVTQAVRYAPG
jgi:hypothetical protein